MEKIKFDRNIKGMGEIEEFIKNSVFWCYDIESFDPKWEIDKWDNDYEIKIYFKLSSNAYTWLEFRIDGGHPKLMVGYESDEIIELKEFHASDRALWDMLHNKAQYDTEEFWKSLT